MTNIEKIQKMDELMKDFEKDVKFLKEVLEKMKKIEEKNEILSEFYYSDEWRNWYDNPELQYWILSEDWLWNLFYEKQEIEKEILKYLVNKL